MSGALFLPVNKIAERYSVTRHAVWKWRKNPDVKFPNPITINGRDMWRISDLEKWEIERAGKAA